MKEMRTETENKRRGVEHQLLCRRCRGVTRHLARQTIEVQIHTDDEGYWEQHALVQCQGCLAISYLTDWQDTEDVYHDGDALVQQGHPTLYPPRVDGLEELRSVWHLPPAIRQIYDETRAAVCSGQRVLAAAGVRALVEAVCKERGATGRNLKDKIEDLVAKSVLSRHDATYLQKTRIMGNGAVHEIVPPTEDVLHIAMQIAQHLLRGVYILKAEAAKLKE